MALNDLTRISTSGIATGTSLSGAILHGDAHFRGSQVGVTSALFDSSEDELKFNDNVKLKFGDGGDLNFYHTGSHSFIDDTGTGNLYIQSNHVNIDSGGQEMANFFYGGAVQLFHSNTQRFRTTSTGAVVTGILTATSFSGPLSNASGISTFYDLRVSNNLTVEGTTTTLDTNLTGVDRVEINANSNSNAAIVGIQSGSAEIVKLLDGTDEVLKVNDGGLIDIASYIRHIGATGTSVGFPDTGSRIIATTNGSTRFTLDGDGRILVGITTATFLASQGGSDLLIEKSVGAGGTVSIDLYSKNATGNSFVRFYNGSQSGKIGLVGIGHSLIFCAAGVNAERMRLTNVGLGIGTTIPTKKLDVNGTAQFQDDINIKSGNPIILANAANSASTQILCDGGARLHLKSYNQTVATFEEGVATTFYQSSGTNRLQITPTGSIIVGAGTTIKIPDKIMHYGDEDTYFDFGTNTINLHAGGVTGITVLDTSVRVPTKLGINGAAPQTPLDVIANGSGYAINIRGRSSDNVGELRFTSNDYGSLYSVLQTGATYLKISTGGQERLELDVDETTFNNPGADTDFRIRTPAQTHMFYVNAGTNQVCIKTSNAASGAELTVNGRTHTDTQFTIGSNSTLDAGVQATIYKPATNTLAFATAGANERLRIDNNGKLILGTEFVNAGNSPASISFYLSGVRGSYGGLETNAVIFDNQTAAVDAGGTLQLAGYSGTSAIVKAAIRGGNEGSASTQNGYFAVFTRPSSGGLTERLRIDSGGTSTFDVGSPESSNKVIGRFQAQSSRQLDIVWHDSGSLMGFNTPGNHSYIFKCNNTERLRIRSDGDTTISASASANFFPGAALDIISDKNVETAIDDKSNYHLVLANPNNDTGEAIGIAFGITDTVTKVGAAIVHERDAAGSQGSLKFFTRPNNAGPPTEKVRITHDGVVDVTGEINVDHSGGGSGAALNGISGENCAVVRWRGDNHHAIILRGSSNADGSTITGGNTTEFREYGAFSFKTGTGNMAERIRITNSEMKFTANQTFNADNTYWIGTNGIKPSRVYGHKFVHREGTSNGVGVNEQEAIWYGGGITVMHDNLTLNTTNYTWGLTGVRGYALLRIRNGAGSPQAIYAEAGTISSGSDYRMKENIEEITNGMETVKKLKPCIYNIRKSFNPNDDGKKHHGFIAHEVQEAIPDIGNIVSGTKDAMEEVFYQDEDENIPEGKKPGDSTGTFTDKPDYQGIDYGHMTPVLAAAIKELITKVETLEAEVAALKSS